MFCGCLRRTREAPQPDQQTAVKKSQLCSLCEDFVTTEETTFVVTHVRDYEATNSSAASGCQLCSLLYQEVSHDLNRFPEIIMDGKFSFEVLPDSGDHVHKIYVVCKDKLLPTITFQNIEMKIMQEARGTNTGSPEALSMAKCWLETCVTSHKRCKPASEIQLPTRLLEISGDIIRLHHSNDLKTTVQYVSLSHCWGNNQYLLLLKENMKEMEIGIQLSRLSQTFQDAIATSVYFECRYIWIDTLCIIQNDTDDWRREAAKMGSVYSNAYFNIAATRAADGSQGCFVERHPRQISRAITNVMYSYEPRGENRVCQFLPSDIKAYCFEGPLSTRGWVFQEKFLAKRTLHFSHSQLAWECTEMQACEQCPEGLSSYVVGDDEAAFTGAPTLAKWMKVVQEYSSRSLTKWDDRLIAVSSVARHFHRYLKCDYLGGLWRDEFGHQLLWSIDHKATQERPPRASTNQKGTYVAPSWSWASVPGFLGWGITFETKLQPLVKLIETHTDPVGSDVFGQLSSGFVRLQGTLLWDTILLPVNGVLTRYSLDKSLGSITLDDESLDLNASLLLLPIAFRYLTDVGLDDTAIVQGIALKTVYRGTEPLYNRAGHFNISKKLLLGETLHTTLIKAASEDSGLFHYEQEIEVGDHKEYIITIF